MALVSEGTTNNTHVQIDQAIVASSLVTSYLVTILLCSEFNYQSTWQSKYSVGGGEGFAPDRKRSLFTPDGRTDIFPWGEDTGERPEKRISSVRREERLPPSSSPLSHISHPITSGSDQGGEDG